MTWRIRFEMEQKSNEYLEEPLIAPSGFREYDARWRYPEQLNLIGVQCLGAAVATQGQRSGGARFRVVVGNDYREYSTAIKEALIAGLLSAGAEVFDLGLVITPVAYFARGLLGVSGVAFVTASHNENGWTGIKIGLQHPLTHGPEEMKELKDIVYSGDYVSGQGIYHRDRDVNNRYLESFKDRSLAKKGLRIVTSTGNGTAGLYVSKILNSIGCQVLSLHQDLDWDFPNHNPNPESMEMLKELSAVVLEKKADLGLAFDGDGDRIGVVDETGREIFSDKIGLLLARKLSEKYRGAKFLVDVKSTGLFSVDQVLRSNGAATEYWVTGHSYIKRRMHETGALAGFEKSGHFFFSPPVGLGYDDAMLSAALICGLVDSENKTLGELVSSIPRTWQTPTMSLFCPDESKYEVVDSIRDEFSRMNANQEELAGKRIAGILTVNGVRVTLDDGSWGLLRASSNKPNLVVVAESPSSEDMMIRIFEEIDSRLRLRGLRGDYDQKTFYTKRTSQE